ncbi:MAG TPA: hypothetical protein VF747_05045 [Blastocatellia bacterium]
MPDEEMRLTRLENAFSTLVELAQAAEERLDQSSQDIRQHDARLLRLEASFVTLVELAQITDERLDEITGTANTLNEAMISLTEAQTHAAEAQAHADLKLAELAEAGAHTDERLNALINIIDRQMNKNGDGTSQ